MLGQLYERALGGEGCWIRPFGNIVYLMPAFTIGEDDLAALTDTVVKVIGET